MQRFFAAISSSRGGGRVLKLNLCGTFINLITWTFLFISLSTRMPNLKGVCKIFWNVSVHKIGGIQSSVWGDRVLRKEIHSKLNGNGRQVLAHELWVSLLLSPTLKLKTKRCCYEHLLHKNCTESSKVSLITRETFVEWDLFTFFARTNKIFAGQELAEKKGGLLTITKVWPYIIPTGFKYPTVNVI